MTKEEKHLLLIDICAKLPYGLKVKETVYSDSDSIYPPDKYPTEESKACEVISVQSNCVTLHISPFGWKPEILELRQIKPYLRPMSSMTEEEDKEFAQLQTDFYTDGVLYPIVATNMTDWLNAHHFDYNGLIERGLALEATEGMYKTE